MVVLLCNLGTPATPSPQAVRAFLAQFLWDKRVVEIPRPVWWLVLNAFILPFRPKPVSQAYQALWDHYGDSPLRLITQRQVAALQQCLSGQSLPEPVTVDYAFTYGQPSIAAQVERYKDQRIVMLPLYPQFSCSTTAAIYDQVSHYQQQQRYMADVHIIRDYWQHPAYQAALAQSVRDFWQANGEAEHLLVSNHGVPKRYADLGDPYYQQCLQTNARLKADLGLDDSRFTGSFQSRLGRAEWLQPYTAETVKKLAQKGVKTIDVVCPSFAVDCLETLEEIAVENDRYFREAGGERLRLIPCLNDNPSHIAMMAGLVVPYLG